MTILYLFLYVLAASIIAGIVHWYEKRTQNVDDLPIILATLAFVFAPIALVFIIVFTVVNLIDKLLNQVWPEDDGNWDTKHEVYYGKKGN